MSTVFNREATKRFWEEIRQIYQDMHQFDRIDQDFPFPTYDMFEGACYYVQSDPLLKEEYKSVKDIIELTCMYPDVIKDIEKIITSESFGNEYEESVKKSLKLQAKMFMTLQKDAENNETIWEENAFDPVFTELIKSLNKNSGGQIKTISDLFFQGKEYIDKKNNENKQIKEMYEYLYLKMKENNDIEIQYTDDGQSYVPEFKEWYNQKDRKHTWKGYFDELESWCYIRAWGYMVEQVNLKENRENINADNQAMKAMFNDVIFKPEWEKAKAAMMKFKGYNEPTQINYVKDITRIFDKIVEHHTWFSNAFSAEILDYNMLINDLDKKNNLNDMYQILYNWEFNQNMLNYDADGTVEQFEKKFPLENQSLENLKDEITALFTNKVFSNLVDLETHGKEHLYNPDMFPDQMSEAGIIVCNNFTITQDIDRIKAQLEQHSFEEVSNTLNNEKNTKSEKKVSNTLNKDILFEALQDFWVVERVNVSNSMHGRQWNVIRNAVYNYCTAETDEVRNGCVYDLYIQCRNYLNLHTKDSFRQNNISGQVTLEGRLRKQAIVQILSVIEDYALNKNSADKDCRNEFSAARELYLNDVILRGEKAHDLDIEALEQSLARGSKSKLKKTLPRTEYKKIAYAELKEVSKSYIDDLKKQINANKAKGTEIDTSIDPVTFMKNINQQAKTKPKNSHSRRL